MSKRATSTKRKALESHCRQDPAIRESKPPVLTRKEIVALLSLAQTPIERRAITKLLAYLGSPVGGAPDS